MLGKPSRRKRKRLAERGVRAKAKVLEIAGSGPTLRGSTGFLGDQRVQVALKSALEVRSQEEPPFRFEGTVRYPKGEVPATGDEIEVLFDPDDRETLVLAPPTTEQDQARAMAALGKAKVGFGVDRASGGADPEQVAQAMKGHEEAMAQAQGMLAQAQQMMGQGAVPGGSEGASADTIAELERLQALKESGDLSEEEFEAAKAQLLGGT